MKKIVVLLALVMLLGGGYLYLDRHGLPSDAPGAGVGEWTSYCEERGGSMSEQEIDGELVSICFVNDGLDGIRCQAELFYEGECGVQENAQQHFLDVRGNPDVYSIYFSDAKFDETGKIIPRSGPLRAEVWIFDAPDNKVASFENGFYLSEEPTGLEIDVQDHDISPLLFDSETSKSDVKKVMGGQPDCTVESSAGPHTIQMLKYEASDKRPGGTFSFSDEQIIAVTMGVGYSEFPDKLCE